MWNLCFFIAALLFVGFCVLSVVLAKSKYKSGRLLDASKSLFTGVILSAVVLFIPVYVITFRETDCTVFETVLLSVHNVIRLFVVDGDFTFVTDHLVDLPFALSRAYSVFFALLFVMAPALTFFGVVLSVFKNVSAYKKYISNFFADVFVFSELNEKSLALAESLYQNGLKKEVKKRVLVFTDVFETEEEESYELLERVKELGAIRFKKDIVTINFGFHSKKSDITFFIIGEDQSENISQALTLVEQYKQRENTDLYAFSSQVESEMLLAGAFSEKDGEMKIRVRRVNEIQSLITRNLYDKGYEYIFESAYDDGSNEKQINALVVGMGRYGVEMTRTLPWFCQMDGYAVTVHAFSKEDNTLAKFKALCPELMAFNGVLDIPGENRYTIEIHEKTDVDEDSFEAAVAAIKNPTYVLIALGNDEKNIATAIRLRTLFERMGCKPKIQAMVYNSGKKKSLADITNFKKEPYDIDFIGDMKSFYCEDVILNSEVEKAALRRHMSWGDERAFWQYDYNYKSSVASAIHRKMKILCGIPGIEKPKEERTEEELWGIRILEHQRWNAYMRSEGYVYSGDSQDKTTRNDLGKMHHCLVPFAELLEEEKIKDDD